LRKHIIYLQTEQRQQLEALTSHGQVPARKMKHAQILLKSEQNWSDQEIMQAFDMAREPNPEGGFDLQMLRTNHALLFPALHYITGCAFTDPIGVDGSPTRKAPLSMRIWRRIIFASRGVGGDRSLLLRDARGMSLLSLLGLFVPGKATMGHYFSLLRGLAHPLFWCIEFIVSLQIQKLI
jgi:hypothetical protein